MSSVVVVVVLKYRCSKTLYFFDIHVFVVDSDMFVRLLVCLFSFDEVLAIMNDSFFFCFHGRRFFCEKVSRPFCEPNNYICSRSRTGEPIIRTRNNGTMFNSILGCEIVLRVRFPPTPDNGNFWKNLVACMKIKTSTVIIAD